MADASRILETSSVNLEKNAYDSFGAAVEDFSRGSQEMGPNTFQDNSTPREPRNDRAFYATSYAAALAGPTSFRPKLKFLFKVQFFFTEEAKRLFSELNGGDNSLGDNDFTFMVKSVDRPKVDMEYEDDVNMYNFRTKVLKKIRHRELTMTFLDDTGNRVFDFFDRMMMLHSPITRRSKARVSPFDKPTPYLNTELGNGMVFSNSIGDSEQAADLSHRGVINSPVGNAIESIRVKQIFVDSSQVDISNALKQNCFDFINPRIVSFDLDELSHETSDVSSLTLQFDYDWLEMVTMTITNQDQLTPTYDHIANPSAIGAPIDLTPSQSGNGITNGSGNGDQYAGLRNFTPAPLYMAPDYTQDYRGGGNGKFYAGQNDPYYGLGLVQNARSDFNFQGAFSFVKNNNTRAFANVVFDSNTVRQVNARAYVKSNNTYTSDYLPTTGET